MALLLQRLSSDVLQADGALGDTNLSVRTAVVQLVLLLQGLILITLDLRESPELAGDDDLAAGKFELCAAEGLVGNSDKVVLRADGDEDLSNADAGGQAGGLSVRLTHAGLETIRAGARKHLVDAENVEWVHADTHVEGILTRVLRHVLVRLDTGSLEGFAGDLLNFARDDVECDGVLVDAGLSGADVVVTDLWVRNTAAEAALWVRLVLAEPVAARGTATHFLLLST